MEVGVLGIRLFVDDVEMENLVFIIWDELAIALSILRIFSYGFNIAAVFIWITQACEKL